MLVFPKAIIQSDNGSTRHKTIFAFFQTIVKSHGYALTIIIFHFHFNRESKIRFQQFTCIVIHFSKLTLKDPSTWVAINNFVLRAKKTLSHLYFIFLQLCYVYPPASSLFFLSTSSPIYHSTI